MYNFSMPWCLDVRSSLERDVLSVYLPQGKWVCPSFWRAGSFQLGSNVPEMCSDVQRCASANVRSYALKCSAKKTISTVLRGETQHRKKRIGEEAGSWRNLSLGATSAVPGMCRATTVEWRYPVPHALVSPHTVAAAWLVSLALSCAPTVLRKRMVLQSHFSPPPERKT